MINIPISNMSRVMIAVRVPLTSPGSPSSLQVVGLLEVPNTTPIVINPL